MIERLTKPQASPIPWHHYDDLRADIICQIEAGRDPIMYMLRRCWGADPVALPAYKDWLVYGWPKRRAKLMALPHLSEATAEGRLKAGDLIVMVSFGGGMTYGASVWVW